MRVDLYDYRVCMAATHIRHQDVQSRSAADEDVYKASVAMCACCGAGNAFVSFRVPAVGIKALQAAHDGCIEDAALLATHVLFAKAQNPVALCNMCLRAGLAWCRLWLCELHGPH